MASSSVDITPSSQPDFRKMNKQALRDALASRGLDTNGLRPSLIQRLESFVKALSAAEAVSTSVGNATLVSDAETSLTQSRENARKIVTQTDLDVSAGRGTQTVTTHSETLIRATEKAASKSEDKSKTQDSTTASGVTTNTYASSSKRNTGRVSIVSAENGNNESKSSNAAHLSDLDRKRMRAERFGVGLQISEKEKLALRAERFAGAGGKKSSSVREPESEKRKQRAARFGIVDDESRKKARQERFASAPKHVESVEMDRRKARGERFGASSEPIETKE